MNSADAARQVPWLRYALLAASLTAVWLVISLFSSAPSASADERDSGSGLLGTVGSLLGGVTEVTGAVGGLVGGVVETVVPPVNQVVEPVVEVLPEPVAEPVAVVVPGAVDTVTETANTVIGGGNAAVGTIVNGVTGTVSGIAGGDTVSGITTPVAGLVDGIVDELPIVGSLLPSGTVGAVLDPVTGLVDDTLGTVVGTMPALPTDGSGVLPQLPSIPLIPGGTDGTDPGGPGDQTPGEAPPPSHAGAPPGVAADGRNAESSSDSGRTGATNLQATARSATGTIAPSDGGSPAGDGSPALGAPALGVGGSGTGAAGSGGGAASGTSDAAYAALELDALASLALHSVDDELPSSPVYDTDSTPD